MYAQTRNNYLHRGYSSRNFHLPAALPVDANTHRQRIFEELRQVNMPLYGMKSMEANFLPNIIHADEHIGGAVFGHHFEGFVMLVATDRRVIFLDKKPMFVNEDEITYDVVSGISLSHAGIGSTVSLHTRVKDYKLKTLSEKCAETFVEYIESRCIEPRGALQ